MASSSSYSPLWFPEANEAADKKLIRAVVLWIGIWKVELEESAHSRMDTDGHSGVNPAIPWLPGFCCCCILLCPLLRTERASFRTREAAGCLGECLQLILSTGRNISNQPNLRQLHVVCFIDKRGGGHRGKKSMIAVGFALEMFKRFRLKIRGDLESLMKD